MQHPERVELVRLRLGLTKAGFAQSLGIDRRTLQRFDAGAELSAQTIAALVELSGYSASFFEKSSPLEYPNPDGVSFRSLRSLTATARDTSIAAAALAFEFDDWIAAEYDLPAHSLPALAGYEPAQAAGALRARWAIGEGVILNMINLLESHGVRVYSLAQENHGLDAYSFWRNDKPYVFLNTMKTAEHSRFDAAHELGHLVLHRHGGAKHRSAEDEANAFASALLMPPADLRAELPYVRSLNDILKKKKRWRVSAAALAYALHKQKIVSDWHYRGYCIELNKLGRESEVDGIERESSQIWQKILTDLWRRGMTLSRLSDELDIPEKELSALLFGIAAPPTRPPVRGVPGLRAVR